MPNEKTVRAPPADVFERDSA